MGRAGGRFPISLYTMFVKGDSLYGRQTALKDFAEPQSASGCEERSEQEESVVTRLRRKLKVM